MHQGLRIEDEIGIRGELRLVIRRRGRIVETWHDRNLVVSVPRTEIARAIAEGGMILPVTHVAVGTNGTPAQPGDTAISNSFVKPLLAVTRPTPTSVQFTFAILESDANGLAIAEFGLLRSDGSLFARRTRGVIEKQSDLEIDGTWTIQV